jgi:uncharacterized protein (DUF433 family)
MIIDMPPRTNSSRSAVTQPRSRISINPRVCGGRPCVRDTRVRVIDVLELLASGMTARQIVKQLPYLELEDIPACLAYAAGSMNHPRLVA